jgi:hypothetical protein
MKIDLEKLKEYTRKTSLTSEEKFDMLSNIREYTDKHPIHNNYYSIVFRHSLVYASMFALVLGTTATSFATEKSLPGDLLYPVKTEINENIVKTFSITKDQKAKTNVKLIDKRMEELTEMIVTEKDTPEKIDTIVEKLEEHKQDIQEYIQEVKISNSEEVEDAEKIYIELESVIDNHLDILENMAEDQKNINTQIEANDSIKITANTSTSEEVENLNNSTSTKDISGEEDAVSEISDFSNELKPIITEAKLKMDKNKDGVESTK